MDVTVRGSIKNTAKQILHIVSELSALFISKSCLQDLRIISHSFPLPEHPGEVVDAIHTTGSSSPPHPQLHADPQHGQLPQTPRYLTSP